MGGTLDGWIFGGWRQSSCTRATIWASVHLWTYGRHPKDSIFQKSGASSWLKRLREPKVKLSHKEKALVGVVQILRRTAAMARDRRKIRDHCNQVIYS
jgi:hypothetical protein